MQMGLDLGHELVVDLFAGGGGASPDCKHFSKAKGGRPVSKKIRGLAWVVVRWLRRVRPRVMALENVEEFADWGPVLPDGRPCPIRVEINKNLRRQYWKDPEKARASRRKAAIQADQYERKKAYMRRYYQQNRERILARQKARDAAKRNGETNEQS